MEQAVSVLGLFTMLAIAWALSVDRKAIKWRPVIGGTLLQVVFALLILRTDVGRQVFDSIGAVITRFLDFTDAGASFVFGERFKEFYFAFKVLPTIIFFSSFITILYYFGILQWVVKVFAKVMIRAMGTSGSESLSASANIFVGQTEAPLLIRPYVPTMTKSELMAVMTGGFATVAGGVHGGLHRHGGLGQAPAGGERDVGAGGAGHGQADVPREGAQPDQGQGRDRGRAPLGQRHRRRRRGRGRRPQAGVERRRHADRLRRPDRADRLADHLDRQGDRLRPGVAALAARRDLQAARLGDGRALGGRRPGRHADRHQDRASTSSSATSRWRRWSPPDSSASARR